MTVGERIKARREELNLTQEELARKVGYKSRSSINKIELSRDLPLRKVEKMAIALGTTPSDLMGWKLPCQDNMTDLSENDYILFCYHILSPEAKEIVDDIFKKAYDKSTARKNGDAVSA